MAHVMEQSEYLDEGLMEGFVELGGFRTAPQLTAISLYVIACMPYSLTMWSVLGMPENDHHGHQTLRQWTSFSRDTSGLRYIKSYHKIHRTLDR